MSKLVVEVRFELELDEEELKLYREKGLSDLLDSRCLSASEFDEITYEEVLED